jgi:adenylate cyclase class IV
MSPRQRKPRVDVPEHLSDESAAQILDFLQHVTAAFETRYFAQIDRYYKHLRADMMSTDSAQRHRAPSPNSTDTDPPF